MKIFNKSGFVWEKCPYILWICFSLLKVGLLSIWVLFSPQDIYKILQTLYIILRHHDGEAEKRMNQIWKGHNFALTTARTFFTVSFISLLYILTNYAKVNWHVAPLDTINSWGVYFIVTLAISVFMGALTLRLSHTEESND